MTAESYLIKKELEDCVAKLKKHNRSFDSIMSRWFAFGLYHIVRVNEILEESMNNIEEIKRKR